MPKYLDPKNDIVFKKIFGQHIHLLKSFLNAVLPFPEGCWIESLDYLPAEQVPSIPILKRTIVDVKCKDTQGRVFIVEMQMEWTDSFRQRLLFGAAQAFVKQLSKGENYTLLCPVYGLGLVNEVFDSHSKDGYHHYTMVELDSAPKKVIEGLTLVFVELPKFKPLNREHKKLRVLWLRFLRELNEKTRKVDPAFLEVEEIREALQLSEEAAYTPGELASYEDYWDAVSTEKTLLSGRHKEGLEKGLEKGLERGLKKGLKKGREQGLKKGREQGLKKGREQGLTEGRLKALLETAKKMKANGFSEAAIIACTGLRSKDLKK